jgi:hypothetical protein
LIVCEFLSEGMLLGTDFCERSGTVLSFPDGNVFFETYGVMVLWYHQTAEEGGS